MIINADDKMSEKFDNPKASTYTTNHADQL